MNTFKTFYFSNACPIEVRKLSEDVYVLFMLHDCAVNGLQLKLMGDKTGFKKLLRTTAAVCFLSSLLPLAIKLVSATISLAS